VQGGPPPPLRDPGGGARSLADQVLDGVQLSGAPAEATRADGSLLRASVSGAPLRDAAGAAAGAVLLVEDVGEQIELRAALQRSATMGALGQLLGAVAHEVRSPLFGITATLDTLEVLHGPDPRMAAVETTLRREADRLALLMSDLLEYGKPAPRELQAARLAVPLAQAVRDTEQLARGAKVAVEVSLPASLQPLRLDEGRMAQVFRNLLENAVQHSPPGGVVRVEAAEELVRARAVVSVRILDSGKGFSPRDLTQLFEPFYTRRKGGTGLGLSIVQRIVEQHGGSVEAANQPSGGAQITVRLPVEAS
jgi:signal transduction histidine kinase